MPGMYRHRLISDRVQQLAESFPVVVVSGARQVGKTTLLRHVFPAHDYVVFDPSIDLEGARREPELFLRNHPPPVILDEIQYAPELVSAIKRQVDRTGGAPGQFLLASSQQWQVMQSMADSLAGRVAFLDLMGFSLQEPHRKPGVLAATPARCAGGLFQLEPAGQPLRGQPARLVMARFAAEGH